MSEEWNRREDETGGESGTGASRGGGAGSGETPNWPTDPGAGQPTGGSVGPGAPPLSGGFPPSGSELPPPYVPPAGPPSGSYAPPTAPLPGSYIPPTAPLPGMASLPETTPPQRTGMSSTTKIVLIVVGVLAVCCIAAAVALGAGGLLLGRTVGNAMTTSPEQAAQIGHSILNYKLPPGYREVSSMNLLGNQMVFITRQGQQDGLFIMIAKLMAGTAGSEEQFRRQFEDQMSRSMGASGAGFTQTGTRQLTINGQPATMTISEGSGNNGRRLRQGVAVFSQGGAAGLLMIMGPVEAWDSNDLSSFLDSIR
ncbi:MAG: hypothetical protein KIT87_01240 [Anaerolineae bacterium]|nr:hypothetical protein [Anaerolineae bacterium]